MPTVIPLHAATPTFAAPVQTRVEIESLAPGVDLSEPLTRARFEELNNDLFKKTLGPVRKVSLACFCAVNVMSPGKASLLGLAAGSDHLGTKTAASKRAEACVS